MQRNDTLHKVIYSDSGRDIAITGKIVLEDDFFITIENGLGRQYKIGKRAIILIKEANQ